MAIAGYTDRETISKRSLPLPVFAMVKKGAEKPEKGVGKNLSHFRFDWQDKRAEEVFNQLYGEDKQSELLITVLADEVDAILDSSYRLYGSNNILKRQCDGCTIMRSLTEKAGSPCLCDPAKRDSDDAKERAGQCSPKGYFHFILPDLCKALGYLGQFILITGSVYEMRDIATVLYNVKQSSGHLTAQPFLMRRIEKSYAVNGKNMTQWNVEIIPPIHLVIANIDTPILASPNMDALPSGFEEEEREIGDWVCTGCGNMATTEQAYSLLLECPDCGQAFVYRGDGEAPKPGDKLPEVKRFTPPAQPDKDDVDSWIGGEYANGDTPEGKKLMQDEIDRAKSNVVDDLSWLRQNRQKMTPEQRYIADLIEIVNPICDEGNPGTSVVEAAILNGIITSDMSLDKAAGEVFKQRCKSKWGLADEEIPTHVEKALGRGLRAYFADNPRDYQGVWQALIAYFVEFPL